MVCYTGYDENKKLQFSFKPYTALSKSKERIVAQTMFKDGINYELNWELKPGMKIILKKNENENLKDLPENELLKRVYKVNNMYPARQGKYEYFYASIYYHLNVVSTEIKLPNESKNIDFENPKEKPLVRINLAKAFFAIESKDFEIKIDGTINLLTK